MGGTSEREFMEKLGKIRDKTLKAAKDIKNDFAKMEKIKAESLKKTEEMRRSTEHDVAKLEQEVIKTKDLAPESITRLNAEITVIKNEIQQRYNELKSRISAAIVPE
jgi:hypothetical protein